MPDTIRTPALARANATWGISPLMGNTETLASFQTWLLSTSRGDGTIRLRIRHATQLAQRYDLTTVTTDDLEGILFERRGDAAETRKSLLASWRVLFKWAVRKNVRLTDPTLDVEAVHVPVKVPRIAPDDAILTALSRATHQQRAMILLARYACLRLTELTTLHTSNREGDMLRIIGKGGKERMVGINTDLAAALDTLEREQGRGYYLPGHTGAHMHPQSVHKIILRITGWNPHSLRHAGATAAYNATRDLRGIQAMLGHSSLATTQRYLHLDAEALRNVAAATTIQQPLPTTAGTDTPRALPEAA